MKKVILCLLLVTIVSASLKAQVESSKWNGIFKLDNPLNVRFDFNKDTVNVINLDQNTILETMIYTINSKALTFRKISGQSDCNSSSVANYIYEIKDNMLLLTLVDDECEDRSSVLNHLQLTKNTL